jgi:hypothetical protein
MTLLNQTSDGLLPAMIALRRALIAFGAMPREDLERLCAPPSLGDQIAKRRLARSTLSTWIGLGMFSGSIEAEGKIEICEPFRSIHPDDIDSLRTAVLDLLMRPDNVPNLTEEGDPKNSRAIDFARCASWLLGQDPYRLASTNENTLRTMSEEQQTSPQLFPGTGRWLGFQAWGYFAGLGLPTELGFVMNPARAIRAVLNDVLPMGSELVAEDFVERLAQRIPVLDRGSYRYAVEQQTANPWKSLAGDELSPSLSLALVQLNHEVELVLEDRMGDVASRLTLLGRGGRPWRWFTHLRRGAPVWQGARHNTAVTRSCAVMQRAIATRLHSRCTSRCVCGAGPTSTLRGPKPKPSTRHACSENCLVRHGTGSRYS